jgi:hypothetical protein
MASSRTDAGVVGQHVGINDHRRPRGMATPMQLGPGSNFRGTARSQYTTAAIDGQAAASHRIVKIGNRLSINDFGTGKL